LPAVFPANVRMKFLPTLTLATCLFASSLLAGSIPDELKTGGFAVGCQAYTFNRFSVFEAIEKTAQAGGKVIEFYPGQKLSKEEPTLKFGHETAREVPAEDPKAKPKAVPVTDEEARVVWDKVKAKCKEHGITPMAYGVVGLSPDEAKSRKVFEFCKAMGIRVINTESVDALDTAEKLVKEFDIKVGIHDHPKRPDNPNYRVWDPNYVLEVTKDRDARMGACADIGHWIRSGLKPVDCLRILKGRIMSSHMKDLHAPLPSGHDVPWGQGVSGVKECLDEMKAQGFEGPISVEYEHKWEDNVGDAKLCIDFVRAYGAGK
jgi:sugar phosphate isomerase/epimerase